MIACWPVRIASCATFPVVPEFDNPSSIVLRGPDHSLAHLPDIKNEIFMMVESIETADLVVVGAGEFHFFVFLTPSFFD